MPRLRYLVGVYLTAGLAVGCGGGTLLSSSSLTTNTPHHAAKHSQTFTYTGYYENFNAPSGVKYLTITASGASGGGGSGSGSYGAGGEGALVKAKIPVKQPGETLYVYVGGQGTTGSSSGTGGGFDGGGDSYAGGGGGASGPDIRQ
jgi:hypothetical protein